MKRSVTLLAFLAGLAVARANYDFTISLTGAAEVPANASAAAGGGIASFDPVAMTISLNVFFVGLAAPATASHIHDGALGVNGGVIVSFVPYTPSATFGSITGGPLAFPSANVADLLAGNTYFNIHDSVFPGGEIRGQLIPTAVPEPSAWALAGLAVGFGGLRRRRT